MRRPRILFALLAVVIAGLAIPSAAQGALHVLKDQEDAEPVEVVTFNTAKCRKARSKRALLQFTATARKSGYRLSVNVWKRGLNLDLVFGGDGPADVNVSGPQGSWTSLNRPPRGVAAGQLVFNNRKKTRMGLGFSPMFNDSFTNTASVGGGVKCRYKRRRRR